MNRTAVPTQNQTRVDGPLPALIYTCNFQSTDGRLVVLCCNLFSLSPADLGGQVDYVFDRGSLVAISPSDRLRYKS
jgi:hypothetical protein